MTAWTLLNALGAVDDRYVAEAERPAAARHAPRWRRVLAATAVLAALLALCGFAAYECGLFDLWIQKPSPDPLETVRSAIENQAEKDYALAVQVGELVIDEAETARVAAMYRGSELAGSRGWTDEDLSERFLAVRARYNVQYDHGKTFLPDGELEQLFYLMQSAETGEWAIVDNTSAADVRP